MATKKKSNGKHPVMIRAYSGVFYGYLTAKRGGGEFCEVDLAKCRHIWSWQSTGLARKAICVEDLALLGAGDGTKISGVVASMTICDVKLIVPCTPESAKRIEGLPCL